MLSILRQSILAADPAIIENEKWNSPNFTFEGEDRVTLRIHPKGYVQVIFHRGAKKRVDAASFHFDDPTGLLEWPAPDRAVLTVADIDAATAVSAELTQLVRRWIHAA